MLLKKTSAMIGLVALAAVGVAQSQDDQNNGMMQVYDNGKLVVNKQFHGEPMMIQLPSHHGKGPQSERVVIQDHGPHGQSSEVISYSDNTDATPEQMHAMLGSMQQHEAHMDAVMMQQMDRMENDMQQDMHQAFSDFPQPTEMQMPDQGAPAAPMVQHAATEEKQTVAPHHSGKRTFREWWRDQFSS